MKRIFIVIWSATLIALLTASAVHAVYAYKPAGMPTLVDRIISSIRGNLFSSYVFATSCVSDQCNSYNEQNIDLCNSGVLDTGTDGQGYPYCDVGYGCGMSECSAYQLDPPCCILGLNCVSGTSRCSPLDETKIQDCTGNNWVDADTCPSGQYCVDDNPGDGVTYCEEYPVTTTTPSTTCTNLDIVNGYCTGQNTYTYQYCWENQWLTVNRDCRDLSQTLVYCREPTTSSLAPTCDDVCSNQYCTGTTIPNGSIGNCNVDSIECGNQCLNRGYNLAFCAQTGCPPGSVGIGDYGCSAFQYCSYCCCQNTQCPNGRVSCEYIGYAMGECRGVEAWQCKLFDTNNDGLGDSWCWDKKQDCIPIVYDCVDGECKFMLSQIRCALSFLGFKTLCFPMWIWIGLGLFVLLIIFKILI